MTFSFGRRLLPLQQECRLAPKQDGAWWSGWLLHIFSHLISSLYRFLQASPKLMVMTRWPLVLECPPKETATHEGCFFLTQPQKKWCHLSTQIKNHVLLLPQSLQKRLMIDRIYLTQFPPFIQTANQHFHHRVAKRPKSVWELTC